MVGRTVVTVEVVVKTSVVVLPLSVLVVVIGQVVV